MNNHSYTPLYRRILLATAMLAIALMTTAALIHYGTYGIAAKVSADKAKVGVVRGVLYSPPNSCAVVGETMVHEGDAVGDIAVVAIQSNAVEFSKAGITWEQEVLEKPHKAWKQ